MAKFSLNNRLILEPYKTDKSLQAKTSNGFAMVQQKVAVKGLKVLVGTTIIHNGVTLHVPAGSTAYIREEILHTQPWAVKALECETMSEKFIVVDSSHVDFIDTPGDDAA